MLNLLLLSLALPILFPNFWNYSSSASFVMSLKKGILLFFVISACVVVARNNAKLGTKAHTGILTENTVEDGHLVLIHGDC